VLNRALASFLTEVGVLDPFVIGVSALLVVLAASLACVPPLLQALRLDAFAALKAN